MTRDASDILILIPAAGASSRMRGRDKLLELVDAQPLLARQARRALETGAQVLVTLPKARTERRAALTGLAQARLQVQPIDGREGMAASIRAGAAAAEQFGASALMIVLPDMPELETADFDVLIAAHLDAPDTALRAASEAGAPGHPVIFPRRFFGKLGSVTGDAGARGVLRNEQVRLIPLRGNRAVTDLDTPEDWAQWRCRMR